MRARSASSSFVGCAPLEGAHRLAQRARRMLMRGSSERRGLWKTIWLRRRRSRGEVRSQSLTSRPSKRHLTLLVVEQSAQHPDQGRLPGARFADHPQRRVGLDVDRDVGQGPRLGAPRFGALPYRKCMPRTSTSDDIGGLSYGVPAAVAVAAVAGSWSAAPRRTRPSRSRSGCGTGIRPGNSPRVGTEPRMTVKRWPTKLLDLVGRRDARVRRQQGVGVAVLRPLDDIGGGPDLDSSPP